MGETNKHIMGDPQGSLIPHRQGIIWQGGDIKIIIIPTSRRIINDSEETTEATIKLIKAGIAIHTLIITGIFKSETLTILGIRQGISGALIVIATRSDKLMSISKIGIILIRGFNEITISDRLGTRDS